MPEYPYLGLEQVTYHQYLDASTGVTLVAEPGGSYDMTPAAGCDSMPVPPADNRWDPPGDDSDSGDDEKKKKPAASHAASSHKATTTGKEE